MTTVLTVPPQTAISENTITIFSKTWCPYCKRAKALLTSKFADEKTKILEWVSTPFCIAILAETVIGLTSLTRARRSRTTWPRRPASGLSPTSSLVSLKDCPILDASHNHCADQKHVGGCDKVVALDSEGKLAGLVKELVGVSIAVDVREPETIDRSLGKMRRIVDERTKA